MSGANLKTTDSSSNTAFTALHFSYHAKYGVSGKNAPTNVHPHLLRRTEEKRTNTAQFHVYASTDMRRYPEPYELLCIALEDTLEYIANKTLVRLPDFFEGLEGEIDIVPLYDSTPGRPFRSIVINLNCATLAHKDQQDQKGCIVLVISSCSGGELCFFEPKLVLEMFNGDFVAFPSRRYTHFNLHYQGIRSSLVLHSDKDGESYKKDGNGWVHNDFVL
ncbi:uncharacterized protein C8R40DRAFT_1056376 [Lentinula edodes]|uniref:uncharacterized protein n=1 Tax=Lentinula edodes TaxID=5353 RepID=UPI001E8CABDC|nr:uncharacterized protein C8R40DRAFT_1056376 [Lentinula edodes]KAH7870561.1 hypothetical protein C8R40DRAFT_1056376 [Lentinula edodes]